MARGQDAEFVEFADSALPRLRRTAYLLCGDWHRAEDLAQEALVRLYRAWPRISRREGLMPYAHRTVVRLLVDQSRRPWRREVSHADAVDCGTPSKDPSDQVDDRILLVKALQRIGARRRACIVLRYFDDLSVAQTAALLGCTEGTVKSQTARALQDLGTVLRAAGVTGIELREEAPTS